MKGGNEQKGFFIGFVENGGPLEDFDRIEGSEPVGLLPSQFHAENLQRTC
jgi:hypothetical protein